MKVNKIIIVCLLVISSYAGEKELNITYISHFHEKQLFGQNVHSFASSVAKDLNINLTITLSKPDVDRNLNRFEYLRLVKKHLSSTPKPDFALVIFFKGISKKILELSKKYDIPVMVVNTNIPKKDKNIIGEPREIYKNFLGVIAANEVVAGYDISKYLINKKREISKNKKLNIIGIAGPRESPESDSRVNGLKLAVKEDKNSVIRQIVHANWGKDKAYFQMKQLIKRYADIDIVWCASDSMSIGALKAINESNLKNKILTGGIDWTNNGVKSVENKGMTVTAGGHFMNGGLALILLHDYYFGNDFKSELGTQIQINMNLLSNSNISDYLNKFSITNWDKVDFTKFSKVLNSNNKKYDFSLENLFKHSSQ